MCERCGRLRQVEAPAAAGELVCAECGARSVDGVGWKAEVAPDLLESVDDDEVAVYCETCWTRESQEP